MDIQQQKQFRILVIGDSCTDVYHYGECVRISPEAPIPVLRHIKSEEYGGMALNVYENLKGLGNRVDIVTNDEKITKERFIENRTMHHFLRFDTGERKKLHPASKEKINKIIFSEYSVVAISDYDKGFLDEAVIKKILMECRELNIPVFVDSKRKDLSCFEGCVIKINKEEYASSIAFPNLCEIIVTIGKEGAIWREEIFPPAKSEIDNLEASSSNSLRGANVCGAGDTFLSGLITEYLKSKDLNKSIKFANFCAARAIENFGTYVISMEDLNDLCV